MRSITTIDNPWERHEVPLDDRAIGQHVRALAVTLNATGRAPLSVCSQQGFRSMLATARRLAAETESLPASLEWIAENGRIAESFFSALVPQKAQAGEFRLPAMEDGTTRIQYLLTEIVRHSDAALTADRLTGCLSAFDEVRALEMNELWAVPAALASVLQKAYIAAAARATQTQQERIAAMKWVDAGASRADSDLSRRRPAFFECALQRMHEQELPEKRAELENWLSRHDCPAEDMIAIEHERQALDRLQLDHILSTLRMLAALDWSECFSVVSRTEQTLLKDPSGTYPRMDNESRGMIRERIIRLAAHCDIGETTFASAALIAAENDTDIRREICWWLGSDEGIHELLRGMGVSCRNARRIYPDPNGRRYISTACLLAACLLALLIWREGAWSLIAIPALFAIVTQCLNRGLSRMEPRRLMRLKIGHLPEEYRTMIVMPVLLSSPDRARELAFQLETLGCLETDEALTFALLGDLPDAGQVEESGDGAIMDAAREAVSLANARAGRPNKYVLLTRKREPVAGEDRFMAPERKRGALGALCELLTGGENRFCEEEAHHLAERNYAFMITLDAGTKMLPGTAKRLIGTLAHPINRRRYALLAPRMELTADAVCNRFVRIFGGQGGMDTYPTSVSDLWQDLAGAGNFGGKGILDIRAFHEAMARANLPAGRILSHDMLEGLLSGAGFADDITLYEGYPKRYKAWIDRLHRWTRGDWQLLSFIFRRGFSLLDRWKLAANLVRSLMPISEWLLIALGFLTGKGWYIAAGLLPLLLPLLLSLGNWSRDAFERLQIRFSLLPHEAWTMADAIARTLYRLTISKKHLLEWVTADDAERRGGMISPWPGRIAALVVLPAMWLQPVLIVPCVIAAALWWTARARVADMERIDEKSAPNDQERITLTGIAERTWRFFSENTGENGLTPDNVQLDPPCGAAMRTSPTNIGLYLLSCVSACELEIIAKGERDRRLAQTLDTLENLEKWNGQLYNWYDIRSGRPLRPRYVSSVDSGNLAASLLLCASAVGEEALAQRLEALARGMDFKALFDEKRKLFVIGMDLENNRLSGSHYDLLASESRILSFTAMMLGQVPCAHFARLGRACSRVDGGSALISWSGTMFEYLMPCLFLPVWENTLIGASNECVISAQKQHRFSSDALDLPWGVSESGCYSFDQQLNYQYRAFGLSEAALRGDQQDSVITPYASLLALPFDKEAVLENIALMQSLGWEDEQGFFEAADCDAERIPEGASLRLVKSHMAHHQGMILSSICNAMTDNKLVRYFCARPEAQALLLLLQERNMPCVNFSEREKMVVERRRAPKNLARNARRDACDAHLMTGGGTMLAYSAQGASFARAGSGILINRRRQDLTMPAQGFLVHLRADDTRLLLTGGGEATPCKRTLRFEAGCVLSGMESERIKAACVTSVSPEDGAVLQRISVENLGDRPIEVSLTSCFAVALAYENDYEAHPAFQNLFVESEYPEQGVLQFRRRPRSAEEHWPLLVHIAQESGGARLSWETDLFRLTGRNSAMSDPDELAGTLSGTLGRTLQPCSALRVEFRLNPHEKREAGFVVGLTEEDGRRAFIDRHLAISGSQRAEELAATQARELIRYLAIPTGLAGLIDRASSLLLLPMRSRRAAIETLPRHDLGVHLLWALGISGELPMLTVFCRTIESINTVREAMRAHEFYRSMGLACDLVLVNDYGNDYERPVRDRLSALIASSHLCGENGQRGGAHLIEGAILTQDQRQLLRATSAILIDCEAGGFRAQLKEMLDGHQAELRAKPDLIASSRPLEGKSLMAFNGWGGFEEDCYVIENTDTPAPWCNILCNECFGSMVTERGGSFTWHKNSRNGRLTPFDNDPLYDSPGERLWIADGAIRTDPERMAARVTHAMGESIYEGGVGGLDWTAHVFVDSELPVKCHLLKLENKSEETKRVQVQASIDWVMGVSRADMRFVRTGHAGGLIWARGQIGTAAFLTFVGREAEADGNKLSLAIELKPGETQTIELLLGCADTQEEIAGLIGTWSEQGGEARLNSTLTNWKRNLSRAEITTPDSLINVQLNRFLPYQVLCGRIHGRAGYYQAGGAFGFRDQLQDQLSRILTEPEEVRRHILLCAAHQFRSGDVQHWWHPERTGVRTHISDDLLFLPYLTGCYVNETGDESILREMIPFLEDVEIPEGREDWYGEPGVSDEVASLHAHCLRAIERASGTGAHGLLLMGSGDWNDGMNRVGAQGRGESVWLSEFMIAVVQTYRGCCSQEEFERLKAMTDKLRESIEREAWDGKWYLRAIDDEGVLLGSHENSACRIDSISQSWAVLSGLDHVRCESAMNAVEEQLIDHEHGIIRLLTPPFNGDRDPGYIRGYPPGVRENGGQYTHAACWVVLALAALGHANEAWEAFKMLLPASHGDTAEKQMIYRVEPYVAAADVYDGVPHTGRGGWTWYTGAAGWLIRVAWVGLCGFKKRGDLVKMNALLPDEWNEISVMLRVGRSSYTLTSSRECVDVRLDGEIQPEGVVRLIDDGAQHRALFPARLSEPGEKA